METKPIGRKGVVLKHYFELAMRYLRRALTTANAGFDVVLQRFAPRLSDSAHRAIKILTISCLVFFVLLCSRPETKPHVPHEKVWPVLTKLTTFENVKPVIQSYGQIVAAREIDLRALVGGEVVSVSSSLEEGALVKKGEGLFTIDRFEYENALAEAQAQLLGAEATYLTAKTDFERAEKLLAKGTVAKKYLDDRRAAYLSQKANHDRLKIVVQRAKRNLEYTNVAAPFDAYVSNVQVREGRLVNSNDVVATLSDARKYELRFNLSDAEYGALLSAGSEIVGRPVKARWKIGNRQLEFAGKVRRVGAQIDQYTRGVNVYADIINPDSAVLRSGAFVTVALETAEIANIARFPATALAAQGTVFVVKNKRLQARDVTVLLQANNEIFIADGLEAGEEVLLTRFNQAASGLLVQTRHLDIELDATGVDAKGGGDGRDAE